MKKFLKISLINLFILFFAILSIELFFEAKSIWDGRIFISPQERAKRPVLKYINNLRITVQERFFNKVKDEYTIYSFREVQGTQYENKPAIIQLGCSYTFGASLEDKDTFAAVLSKQAHRKVYNWGIFGGGVREALHILRDKELIKNLVSNTDNIEYVIYTYIPDHRYRIYFNQHSNVPVFRKINNEFKEIKTNKFIENSSIKFLFDTYKIQKLSSEKMWNDFCDYIQAIKKEIHNDFKYKNKPVKFVIFVYNNNDEDNWKQLEDKNTTVVRLDDIVKIDTQNVPYILWEGEHHPSAYAWQVIVPQFMKKLKI